MIYRCCSEQRKSKVLNTTGSIIAVPAVNAPGTGYATGDVLTIAQPGSAANARVKVKTLSGTGVASVALEANGSLYSTATDVATTGGSGTGCTVDISSTPNGIDYLEVLDSDAVPLSSPRQQTLLLHCLRPVPPTITRDNILIIGGESIVNIGVDWVAPATSVPPAPVTNPQEQAYFAALADAVNVLVIRTIQVGDFSPYRLRVVRDQKALVDPFEVTDVLPGFDPHLADVTFSFKVECPLDFDCAPKPPDCSPDSATPPPINYLAKDYTSFRGLMLDRMAQLLPGWTATSEADMGIALAELIAYVADHLSYQQDAIATEAYLETARSRISLRRHALLVDYRVSDGCNARTWIHLDMAGDPGSKVFLDRKVTRFYTVVPNGPASLAPGAHNEDAALYSGTQVFEPMWDKVLYPEHNQMSFYTWGDLNCCLPAGSAEATLRGSFPKLVKGDVLIFQEMMGPKTGATGDADIRHRCAVRLTHVATTDASGQPLVDALFDNTTGLPITSPAQTPTPVTEIQWSQADALPFPVCISSTFTDDSGDAQELTDVSVVFGNNVLADHGLTLANVDVGIVPQPLIFEPASPSADHCGTTKPKPLPVRFRPQLTHQPITQAAPFAQVSLGELGNPVTTAPVTLPDSGFVDLNDADGFPALTLQTTVPAAWPQNFGVVVTANSVDATKLDLAVIYAPASGAPGIQKLVSVEKFAGLSLNPADADFVATRINAVSQLIRVPASYVPPSTLPAGFVTTPTPLQTSVDTVISDTASHAFLKLRPTDTSGWPILFAVEAQPSANPVQFDLSVVYDPATGPLGVTVPVELEVFTTLSLQAAAARINGTSTIISVASAASTADTTLSAAALLQTDSAEALPEISLAGITRLGTQLWSPRLDLLESSEADLNFVVEVESDGTATLRFGDDTNARAPEVGTQLLGTYRVGNGAAGNVGADTLTLFSGDPRIASCRNPMPAVGGTNPETDEQIRRRAPQAFLTQQRAVTMDDYAHVAELNPQVDQAVASLRWTGSWYTVFVAADPRGTNTLTSQLETDIKKTVRRYHLAGQDLEVYGAQYVPLQIELEVCVEPDYFRSDVQRSLLQVLNAGTSASGAKGLFHPDNFTFGTTVYLSPIYAAARSVAGVKAVRASTFQPQGLNFTTQYIDAGAIPIGPLQIARLENDPSLPNHGQLSLVLEGGK